MTSVSNWVRWEVCLQHSQLKSTNSALMLLNTIILC